MSTVTEHPASQALEPLSQELEEWLGKIRRRIDELKENISSEDCDPDDPRELEVLESRLKRAEAAQNEAAAAKAEHKEAILRHALHVVKAASSN